MISRWESENTVISSKVTCFRLEAHLTALIMIKSKLSTGLTHLSYKGFSENWSFEFVPTRLKDKCQGNSYRVLGNITLILCRNNLIEITACIVY